MATADARKMYELPAEIELWIAPLELPPHPPDALYFKVWLSHSLGGGSAPLPPPDAAGLGAGADGRDEFETMGELAPAAFTRLDGRGGAGAPGAPPKVRVRVAEGRRRVAAEVWAGAAVWVALYVRDRSPLDAALPPTYRNVGMAPVFLRHVVGGAAGGTAGGEGAVHVVSLFNGTPLKAGFALDRATFRKTKREQHKRTAVVLVSRRAPPGVGAARAREVVASHGELAPRSVLTDAQEVALNRYLYEIVTHYARTGAQQGWHTFMYIAVPGNTVNLGVVTELEYRTTPAASYAAWLRHVLWREGLSDAAFLAIARTARARASPHAAWARQRMRWIVGLACEPFTAIPYRADSIGALAGEYMGTNLLTEKAGDCDNFAIPTYLFVKCLQTLPRDGWAPLAALQDFLADYRPVLTVMSTKGAAAAAHAVADAGAGRVAAEAPLLHMTVVLLPDAILAPPPQTRPEEPPADPTLLPRAIMLEGTGVTGNFYKYWDRVYPRGVPTPAPVADSCRRYDRLARTFYADPIAWAFGTPGLPQATPRGGGFAYGPARDDPFFARFMNVVYEGAGAGPDRYKDCIQTAWPADATAAERAAPGVAFADAIAGRWDRMTFKASPHAAVFSPDAMRAIAAHIEPAPAVIIPARAHTPPAARAIVAGLPVGGGDPPPAPAEVADGELAPMRTMWAAANIEARSDFRETVVPYVARFVRKHADTGLFARFEWNVFEIFPTVHVLVLKFTL